jgi:hypothetical protein
MTRPPGWSDDRLLKKFVDEQFDSLRDEVMYLDAINDGLRSQDEPPELAAMYNFIMTAIYRKPEPGPNEERAVEAALRGDMEPLVDLILPTIHLPLSSRRLEVNPNIRTLSPDTWVLIAEFLTGKRNLRTGKPKGMSGRKRLSEQERRGISHTHDADDEIDVIAAILTKHYPDKTVREVAKRAKEMAAMRHHIGVETLIKYRGRPQKDRRRL